MKVGAGFRVQVEGSTHNTIRNIGISGIGVNV